MEANSSGSAAETFPPRSPTFYSKCTAAITKPKTKSIAPPAKKGGWFHWSKSYHITAPTLFSTGEEERGREDEAIETTIAAAADEDDPPKEDTIQKVVEDVIKDSQFYTPTVSNCGPSVLFKEIKQGDCKDRIVVDYFGVVPYDPVIDLNSDVFRASVTSIKFGVCKQQCGPTVNEKEPAVGDLIDCYLPDYFMELYQGLQLRTYVDAVPLGFKVIIAMNKYFSKSDNLEAYENCAVLTALREGVGHGGEVGSTI
eukprot:15326706-Ditylum_brightwellii.AAC.1